MSITKLSNSLKDTVYLLEQYMVFADEHYRKTGANFQPVTFFGDSPQAVILQARAAISEHQVFYKKIQDIKAYRDATGYSLVDSKRVIEAYGSFDSAMKAWKADNAVEDN